MKNLDSPKLFRYSSVDVKDFLVSLTMLFASSLLFTLLIGGILIVGALGLREYFFPVLGGTLFLCIFVREIFSRHRSFKSFFHSAGYSLIWFLGTFFLYFGCTAPLIIIILLIASKLAKEKDSRYSLARLVEMVKISNAWGASIGMFILSFGLNLLSSLIAFIYLILLVTKLSTRQEVPVNPLFQAEIHYTPQSDSEIYLGAFFALISGLLAISIIATPTFIILFKIIKNYRAARKLAELETLPEKFENIIKDKIGQITERMKPLHREKIKNCSTKLWLERKNHSATPCMIVSARVLNIIFPLGYFKAAKSNPEAADAMLAHELAHYIHNDCNLLLGIRCYFKSADIMPAFIILNTFVSIIIIVFTQMVSPNPYLTGFSAIGLIMRLLLPLLIALPYHYLLLSFLRRRVQRAEELADFYAALVTSPPAVKTFLSEYLYDYNDEESLHPTVGRRIEICDSL